MKSIYGKVIKYYLLISFRIENQKNSTYSDYFRIFNLTNKFKRLNKRKFILFPHCTYYNYR